MTHSVCVIVGSSMTNAQSTALVMSNAPMAVKWHRMVLVIPGSVKDMSSFVLQKMIQIESTVHMVILTAVEHMVVAGYHTLDIHMVRHIVIIRNNKIYIRKSLQIIMSKFKNKKCSKSRSDFDSFSESSIFF